MTKTPDEETRSRAVAKISTLYKLIKDRGAGSDYCEKAIVRNEIRACLEGTMVNVEQALVASWLKTDERTLALHAYGKISRAQADFAWKRAKRGALKSMVHLVHTKTGRGAEHAEDEIVQARLNRIDRGDPKMAEVSEPSIARTALLAELKELEEAFRLGDTGDVCDEAGDLLHCSIYLHAATVEHEEKSAAANRTAARWDTVLLGVQQQERNHRLEWWSEEIRLVLYCSIYPEAATVEHEEKRAANRTAAKWDTVVLRVLVQQQDRNHGLEWWS